MIFGLSLFFICTVILVVFYFRNENNTKQHKVKCLEISEILELHSFQIEKRQNHLRRYNFLEYNLSQCLVVQHEIVL